MKNRKAMVYTTFAIIATSLLILLFTFTATVHGSYTSEKNPFRIGEASYYLKNVQKDLDRAQGIASRRAASSAIGYIVAKGKALKNPEEALKNGTLEGKFENQSLNGTANSSLKSWRRRVIDSAEESRYRLQINFTQLNFEDRYLDLVSNLKASTKLEDPTTLAEFKHEPSYSKQVNMNGYEDTMILLRTRERYINNYKACSFDTPAEKIGAGNYNNAGATYGEAARPGANNKSTKILYTQNTPNSATASRYAGVISTSSTDPGYNTKYVFGITQNTYDKINSGDMIILYQDQVWNSHIRQVMNTGCYFRSSGNRPGPGILERMENSLTSKPGENQGIETVLDKTRIPPQLQYLDRSNVGYVYFNQTGNYGSLSKVAGVTGDQAYGDREYRRGFRLDQYHVNQWNMTGLTY